MTCGPDDSCPAGYVCDLTTDICVQGSAVDASLVDAHAIPDAGLDARTLVDATLGNPADAAPGAPPDTVITTAPPAVTNQTSVNFTFTSTATPAVFQCSLDQGVYAACPTPDALSVTTPGAHTLDVRAVDASGQVDPTPAHAAWTLDLTAPDTTITGGPTGTVNTVDATFTFSSTEVGSTFSCQLDAQPATACVSGQSYTGLTGGMHTFTVTATDPAGNVDPTPATQTWTISVPLPDTMITLGPLPVTGSQTAIFKFISIPDGATFQCSLDKQLPFTACTSPIEYDNVIDQTQHTFDVQAVNANGTDPTPAHFVWSVDTLGLRVAISGGAPNGTSCSTVTFSFAASASPLTYQCALDNTAATDCSSGSVTYTGLAAGSSHVFHVHAVQSDGTVGPDSTQSFVVDGTPPAIAITSPMNGVPTGANTTLIFATEAGATVSCTLDGHAIAGCASGAPLANLAGGAHTVVVNATDACLNQGTAQSSWTVDDTGPTVTIVSPANGATTTSTGTIIFTTSADAVSATCTLDGASVPCTVAGLVQYNSLADGPHTFTVTASDAFGNSTSTKSTFDVDSTPPIVTSLTATGDATGDITVQFVVTDASSSVVEVHCGGERRRSPVVAPRAVRVR